jgi:hypothetical protein
MNAWKVFLLLRALGIFGYYVQAVVILDPSYCRIGVKIRELPLASYLRICEFLFLVAT